jgi:SOS-response transcriptional repressor LexA
MNKAEYKLYRVSGKSMEADSIYQGDFVMVNPKAKIVRHDIVVLSMPDKSFLVKHFYKKDGHLFFYPFDFNHPKSLPGRIMDDATVIGKVVAIVSRHKAKK